MSDRTRQMPDNYLEDEILKLECNIDDCSGEALGFAMDCLLEEGALDVFYTPIFMKKNRPAYLLSVLCRGEDRQRLEKVLFAQTSTIGIRRQRMERTVLRREERLMTTSFGTVWVKAVYPPTGERLVPEYESVAAIARDCEVPFIELYRQIEEEVRKGEME